MTSFWEPDRVRVGIHAGQQHTDFDGYLALWRRAEDLGLDWASVFDHFLPIQTDPTGPCFEGFTLLAAMAAHTSRIRCGMVVSGVTYRHPAVLANIAVTLDHVSGGRFELGIGAAWNEMEHEQYGIDFPPIGRREEMLAEAASILKALWTEPEADFDGRHFRLRAARCEPKPVQRPHLPLWIGGAGERRTLRVVAEHADGWNTFLTSPDEYRHKLGVLADHCAAAGRDPSTIRKALVFSAVLGKRDADLEGRLAERADALGVDAQALRARGMRALTAERLVETLAPYRELGVRDFLLLARPPADEPTLEILSEEVAPALRAGA